ncbi:MAG: hypothetical protein U0840_15050 [Gemmataceae bacterium]
MPIRFRCRHCDQLLGIARRKAGSQVHCPTCRNPVDVPYEDEPSRVEEPDVVPMQEPGQPPPLFERDDFEDLLQGGLPSQELGRTQGSAVRTPPPATRASPAVPPPPPRTAPSAPPPFVETSWSAPQMQQAEVAPTPAGLVLSPAGATVLTVVMILLLAVAFALGLIVGRFLL